MSESSKTLINLLFDLFVTSIQEGQTPDKNEINSVANILDESIKTAALQIIDEKISTVVEEKIATVKPKPKSEKYKTPEECPVGFCSFILERGNSTGFCCSNKNTVGQVGCVKHWKKMDGIGATGPAIESTAKKPAQNIDSNVKIPSFSLKSGTRKFKKIETENTEQKEVATFTKKPEGGKFKAKKLNLTSSITKKAEFFKRVVISEDENGDNESELYFTKDPIGSKFVFMKENGSFNVIGILPEDMNIEDNEEELPSDFVDNIEENFEEEVDEKVSKWFTRNNIVTE